MPATYSSHQNTQDVRRGGGLHEELNPHGNEFGRRIVNPCPNHPYNEVMYLNKSERIGICPECIGTY
jgi:hypothetical protein